MSTISSSQTASELKTDFMNLLINQLRYQNPLEPMSNTDMTAQLAQISQLEQMEKVGSFQEQLVAASQRAEAADLIGKKIMFTPEDAEQPVIATVNGVDMTSGSIMLITDTQSVALDQVQGIANG